MKHLRLRGFLLLTMAACLGVVMSAAAADAKVKARPYTLPICILTGDKLEPEALSFVYEGREIKTCCDMCMDDFYKDPAHYMEKIATEEAKLAARKKAAPKASGTDKDPGRKKTRVR